MHGEFLLKVDLHEVLILCVSGSMHSKCCCYSLVVVGNWAKQNFGVANCICTWLKV